MTASRWPAEPGFNRAAAEAVVKAMTAMDEDAALVFGRLLVAETVRRDLARHGQAICEALDADAQARTEVLQKNLARSAISKARTGRDSSAELAALTALAKDFDPDEARDYHGRWAGTEGRRIAEHIPVVNLPGFRGLTDRHAANLGMLGTPRHPGKTGKKGKPKSGAPMSRADRLHYQQAYLQIADLVAPYRRAGNDALLHLNVTNKDRPAYHPQERTIHIPASGPVPISDVLHPDERITSASVSTKAMYTPGGAVYDAFTAAGASRVGATLAGATGGKGALDPKGLKAYRANLDDAAGEHTASARAFRRLGASSKLLDDSLGPYAPAKLQFATAVGEHLGRYGPEAQKVIGPVADRAAYRYRGTERAIDPRLGLAVQDVKRASMDPAARREYLIHGSANPADPLDWRPSKLLAYFGPNGPVLPKADLNTLQRKSGVIPPSQGVILDSQGRVAVQAVGFGDDWYLPFNLRNLKALKGGEYVRTRTFGGLSTEDIYTGLISGARSMTVVSHSGVFTMEFDPTLRGGRRFNDKAASMTARYGQLLDAVKAEQVTLSGIDPSRLDELKADAARSADPVDDKSEYEAELRRLQAKEALTPRMSEAQKDTAATEFLYALAEQHQLGNRTAHSPEELVNSVIETEAGSRYRGHLQGAKQLGVDPVRSMDFYRKEAYAQLHDDKPSVAAANVAAALGKTPAYQSWMKRSEQENKANLTPLRLDANGYRLAQDALREQFPYYIARVDFHPWKGEHGRVDTGYVKPRHNRPADVLSGYYDTDVAGNKSAEGKKLESGKYRAHTGRYQNHPVHGGKLQYVDLAPKEGKDADTPGSGKKVKLSESEASALQAETDLALSDHILSQERFADGAQLVPGVDAGGDQPAKTFADPNVPSSALKELHTKAATDRAALDASYSDPAKQKEAHSLLTRAVAQILHNKQKPLYNLDDKLLKDFQKGGQPGEEKKPEEDTARILNEIDTDYAWGDRFSAHGSHTVEKLEETYANDPKIKRLLETKRLPEALGDANFDDTTKKVRREIQTKNSSWLREKGPSQDRELRKRTMSKDAVALHRAKQLRRRYDDAVRLRDERARDAALTPAGQANGYDQVHQQVIFQAAPGTSVEDQVAIAAELRQQAIDEAKRARQREQDEGPERKGIEGP